MLIPVNIRASSGVDAQELNLYSFIPCTFNKVGQVKEYSMGKAVVHGIQQLALSTCTRL